MTMRLFVVLLVCYRVSADEELTDALNTFGGDMEQMELDIVDNLVDHFMSEVLEDFPKTLIVHHSETPILERPLITAQSGKFVNLQSMKRAGKVVLYDESMEMISANMTLMFDNFIITYHVLTVHIADLEVTTRIKLNVQDNGFSISIRAGSEDECSIKLKSISALKMKNITFEYFGEVNRRTCDKNVHVIHSLFSNLIVNAVKSKLEKEIYDYMVKFISSAETKICSFQALEE